MTIKAIDIPTFAEMYSLKPETVRTNVTRDPGSLPKVTRINRSVRFLLTDIQEWEDSLRDSKD
jgi:predicted DNA-binding transcriptional regulator AlpA